MQPEMEKTDLLPPHPEFPEDSGRRRPADVYVPRWHKGAPAAFGLAIVSPQRQGALESGASQAAGSTANGYELHKIRFQDTGLQCEVQWLPSQPVVGGNWATPRSAA